MSAWDLRAEMRLNKNPTAITAKLERDKISRLGMNVYDTKIDGIPDGLVEWYLWYRGKCLVWYHNILGWVCTDMSEIGWTVNGIPNKWRPMFETNIDSIPIPDSLTEDDKCVAFYDCMDFRTKRSDVLYYCNDYADVKETIRTQVFNQKTPMIGICGNPKIKQKIKNYFINIANNAKMIFIDSDIKDKVETFDINPVYNVDSLWQYNKAIEADMLEFIGIDSKDAYQKKERLIVDEQEGNDELLNYLLADGLKSRQASIDKCTALGLTASVEIQQLVRPIAEDELLDGGDNGISDKTE